MDKEFTKQLATIKGLALNKQGDVAAVAEEAGVTTQTVRNAFKRECAMDLTEKEEKVISIVARMAKERLDRASSINATLKASLQ